MKQIREFFSKPFFSDYRTLFGLWMILPIAMWLAKMTRANNYDIYRGAFWNAVRGWNIYMLNPAEYDDCHHYGPLFSLLFAPFAIGPKWIGLLHEECRQHLMGTEPQDEHLLVFREL